MHTRQFKEANPIKEKNIIVKLSETDCDKLSKLCGKNDVTVGGLIEAFLGDLIGGTYSNGSDEMEMAQQWFDRCFAMMPQDTLLQYFFNNDYDTDDFLEVINEMESIEADLKEYEINPEEFNKEEIMFAKNDLEAYREEYDTIYKEIIENFKKEYPDADIKKEIQAMREWQEESEDFRYEDAKYDRDKKAEKAKKKISVYKNSECIGEFYNEELLRDFIRHYADKEKGTLVLKKYGTKPKLVKLEDKEISEDHLVMKRKGR